MYRASIDLNIRFRATEDTSTGYWYESNRSGLNCSTAGSREVGRGGTYQGLLLSEAAMYPDTHQWRAGILKTVSRKPGTVVIIETTANGRSNDLFHMWQEGRKGKSDYAQIFLPWFWGDDNKVAWDSDDEPLKKDEIELMREFPGITREHIAWKRLEMFELLTNPNKFGDPEDLFHQEHPNTPSEAFLYSGSPVFSRAQLKVAEQHIERPIAFCSFNLNSQRIRKEMSELSPLHIWEWPEPGHKYIVSGDPAKGLIGGDNSSAHVMDLSTGRIVAAACGKFDLDQFGGMLVILAKYYGKHTPIIYDATGIGEALRSVMMLPPYRYQFLWQRGRTGGMEGAKRPLYGYDISGVGPKAVLINALKRMLGANPQAFRDEKLVEEMHNFIKVGSEARPDIPPRMEAGPGYNDDRVISMALACYLYCATHNLLRELTDEQIAKREEYQEAKAKQTYGRKLANTFAAQKTERPIKSASGKDRASQVETEIAKQVSAEVEEATKRLQAVFNRSSAEKGDPEPVRRREPLFSESRKGRGPVLPPHKGPVKRGLG